MNSASLSPCHQTSIASLQDISLHYGKRTALDKISLELPAGCMIGLIGPDGVGKSSLLALLAGARTLQDGEMHVLGGNMRDASHQRASCPRIAYMPQGLGKNLYPSLSVRENLEFFARLFGQRHQERETRIAQLLAATGLSPFANRAAGKLSGGMKQKLGLCCALIHDPDLLILDEPTTGVDPLSRRQFWELVDAIRIQRPGVSVIVATAYMEEAAHFDWLVAINDGSILATGSPAALMQRTQAESLEQAFIALLPEERRRTHHAVVLTPYIAEADEEIAIEAQGLSMRFGDFLAVDQVSLCIRRGEIFGFLGSNGCGKTTTMKMLTGLLAPSAGSSLLFGRPVDANDLATRRRVGYMSQSFSLYEELSVRQNLELHARLFLLPEAEIAKHCTNMASRFGLADVMEALPMTLPLGMRQRLSLAVAMIHGPEMLILDEPTSGVDPIARDAFWQILIQLAREDRVTIFISTHFMNEAERCDRISLMHAGRVLMSDTPAAICAAQQTQNLEAAFIKLLENQNPSAQDRQHDNSSGISPPLTSTNAVGIAPTFWQPLQRIFAFMHREALELSRDPIRLALSLFGSLILMLVLGYGITFDVENLSYAVLDRDQSVISQDYRLNLEGSRYFTTQAPIRDYADLERRMRGGELSLAIEIPPNFASDLEHGRSVSVAAWIDGAMPTRAETLRGYVQGMHLTWLQHQARQSQGNRLAASLVNLDVRYRYNPDMKSLVAMVPAMIPLLLMLIPAMLTALSVVREKELGAIVNLYVTPVTRTEFLLGKQLPYLALAMLNFLFLCALAVFVFRVPISGSFLTLSLAALFYVGGATALGLLVSAFTRSQIAAMFGTAVITILPAVQFSGLIHPLSSMQGFGAWIGQLYPTTYFITVARGCFAKGLGFAALYREIIFLALCIPVLFAIGVLLLRKQEH